VNVRRTQSAPILASAVCVAFGACRPAFLRDATPPRFVVSAEPLRLIDVRHPGVCVAVDTTDPKGVWWWEPGLSGCSSRSTGPDVFAADDAGVARRPDTLHLDVRFRLQLIAVPVRRAPTSRKCDCCSARAGWRLRGRARQCRPSADAIWCCLNPRLTAEPCAEAARRVRFGYRIPPDTVCRCDAIHPSSVSTYPRLWSACLDERSTVSSGSLSISNHLDRPDRMS
jgi:hypothetical protein